jgi:predicted nucleotidyltransferase
MTVGDLLVKKREDILRLAARRGAHNVRVFGSVARSEAHAGSDVDFLVDVEPGRSLLDVVGLWQDLEDLLRCKVDLVTDGGLSPYLRDRILREARPL